MPGYQLSETNHHEKVYPVSPEWGRRAWVDQPKYKHWYEKAIADPTAFWSERGRSIDWFKPFTKVKNTSFGPGEVFIRWFEDGVTNVAYNCIDRHLGSRGDQVAIIWEGDDPSESKKITYRELYAEVCRMSNVLRNHGVGKGSTVTVYLPMIPEAAYAMLACARLGAIHSVVFGGFSPDSLASRIEGCGSKLVITADEGVRGGRKVPLKANVDAALERARGVEHVIVVRRTGGPIKMQSGRDVFYHDAAKDVTDACPCGEMNAEDPLFILYTSGSTGQPKGVVHTTGGYLVWASMTHKYVFDYHDGDVYWCTADIGWVTGHSYIVYGPLANGATTVMFEGIPTYPTISRFWEVIDKHSVSIFYTAPTAIRSLMGAGEEPVKRTTRKSLKLLGSVGEPINPEAWEWYYRSSASRAVRLSIPGGRRRRVASSSRRCPARPHSSRAQRRIRFLELSRRSWMLRAMCSRARARAISASRIAGLVRCALYSATTNGLCRPISRPTPENTSPAMAVAATLIVTTGSPAG
jgi:acetyl-CoA synthetase